MNNNPEENDAPIGSEAGATADIPAEGSHKTSRSDELSRLQEENQELQSLIHNLSVHERMFHSLFELSHDAILLLDGDIISDCNHSAVELFHFHNSELVENHIEMLLPAVAMESFQRNLRTAIEHSPQFFEQQFVRRDEQLLDCEVSVTALMLYYRQFYMVSIRDITERKQIEHSLRVRSAQLQATINSLPFDFWLNDTQNHTIMQSPGSTQLWGDQYGRHMEEVTQDESIKTAWRDSNDRALKGEVVEKEQAYTIEGQQRIYRNIVAPIWGEGKILGILGLNIDITDYKENQLRLSTALEERETLLREIHHRVKNNLQLIISMLNLQKPSIDSEKPEKSEKTEVLVNIENRINSMALIHDQLYNTTSLNRINMPDYFEKLAGSIRESYDLEQRTISIEISSVDLDLPIDKALPLGIIVNELISNSIKHAFYEVEHGEIKVTLYRVDQSHLYRLRVQDNGGGCSPESLESDGGLGLTLIQQLAMQIGGTADFDTKGGFTGIIEFQTGEL